MQEEAPKLVGQHVYSKGIAGNELKLLEEWGILKRGTQVRPLNRGDLLKLIELNGGTAEYIDLSRLDMRGIDLRGLRLEKIVLSGCNLEDARAQPLIVSHGKELQMWDYAYEHFLTLWANGEELPKGVSVTPTFLRDTHLFDANISKCDLRWVDLTETYLTRAVVHGTAMHMANLSNANLKRTDILDASLQKANLTGASLEDASLKDADLREAVFTDARLLGVRVDTPLLAGAQWSNKYIVPEEAERSYYNAQQVYRTLKQAHQNAAESDTAGQFHYREWECRRKLAQQQRNWFEIGEFWLYRLLSGYSERPKRVIAFGVAVILIFALAYFPYSWPPCWASECWRAFGESIWKSLYFSGVSFTALGYGDWITSEHIAPQGWTRFLGVVESLFGISLIALFLVTFTRKMTR
jgi:uncharacterized protein YjbI with pentapeptide repeats